MNKLNHIYRAAKVLLILAAFVFCIIPKPGFSQESRFKSFKSLSRPEKIWVIFHPFISKKAYHISKEATKMADNLANDRQLDGDKNGGQIDAFRHAFWMASLTQEICWRKARSLGNAHEKGNEIFFKRNKAEDGTIPDKVSCEMDLLNNDIGIKIGREKYDFETEQLVFFIKSEILNGNLWIIKKDRNGNFLNKDGEIIEIDKLKGKWENDKCLVRSDYIYK